MEKLTAEGTGVNLGYFGKKEAVADGKISY